MDLGDLKNPRHIWIKGWLFLLMAIFASTLLFIRRFDWVDLILYSIGIWASCRFYYFAFYVIQHYVDPDYRFASLTDFGLYVLRLGKHRKRTDG